MTVFNQTRQAAFKALTETLDDLLGKDGVTEKRFAAEWQTRLTANPKIIADGWYAPPPQGMAVLFGERISFDTLRNPKFWPSEKTIDWRSDTLFAYCSPIDRSIGIPGDFDITLYFGLSKEIRLHFRKTHKATATVLDAVEAGTYKTSLQLVSAANEIFAQHGFRNAVISINDPTATNMGHSFPVIDINANQTVLSAEQKDAIRNGRLFLNLSSEWSFSNEMQFTVEPQLVSIAAPTAPQISYHYLARQTGSGFETSRDVDGLLKRFDLTP